MSGKVLDALGCGYHHEVVLHDVIAMLIEHKTALTGSAQQVQTGVAQLICVNRIEVGRKKEIYFHDAMIFCKNTQKNAQKQANCAKSENSDVFCETFALIIRCNFAL